MPHLRCRGQVVLMYSKGFGFRGDMGLNSALATNQLVTRDNEINPSETQFPPPKTGYDNDRHLLGRVVLRRAPLLDKRNKGHEATEAFYPVYIQRNVFGHTCPFIRRKSVCGRKKREAHLHLFLPPFPRIFLTTPWTFSGSREKRSRPKAERDRRN